MKRLLVVLERNFVRIVSLAALALIASCALFTSSDHREASTVMTFLYPKPADTHVDTATVPVLSLPLRVGGCAGHGKQQRADSVAASGSYIFLNDVADARGCYSWSPNQTSQACQLSD